MKINAQFHLVFGLAMSLGFSSVVSAKELESAARAKEVPSNRSIVTKSESQAQSGISQGKEARSKEIVALMGANRNEAQKHNSKVHGSAAREVQAR